MLRLPVAVALTCLFGTAVAQMHALPPARHVLVYGDAVARAVPDRFRIGITIEKTDANAGKARTEVEALFTAVLKELDAAGAPSEGITATSLTIEPREEWNTELRKSIYEGIAVSRTIDALFDSQEKLARFLGKLETSDAVQVSGVETEFSREDDMRRLLRAKTIESTKAKASAIAAAYGVRLGVLYSVSDVAPQFDYGVQEGDWPEVYRWRGDPDDDSATLDRIEVTGSKISRQDIESFRTGQVEIDDRIYAVFLLAD